jgi:hypothetical protein
MEPKKRMRGVLSLATAEAFAQEAVGMSASTKNDGRKYFLDDLEVRVIKGFSPLTGPV